MNTDALVKRLRWIMLFVMIVDGVITLLGQPAMYWTDSHMVNEGHPVVRYFMELGVVPFLITAVFYGVGVMILVSVLPRQIGLILLLTVTLWHYYGACTWIGNYFQSKSGHTIYAVLLSTVMVCVGLGDEESGYPIARWKRTTRFFAGGGLIAILLGTGAYLVNVREKRLIEHQGIVETQRKLNEANFVGFYRSTSASFEMLRSEETKLPSTAIQESALVEAVRAMPAEKRKVFLIYEPTAFPTPEVRDVFESRIRSALESAGATVQFLAAAESAFRPKAGSR